MRVLHVIDSLQPGGAERSLASLAPELIERGVHLDVAYFHDRQGVEEQLRSAGAELHSLGGTVDRRRWLQETRSLIRRLEPDLVHTTLFEADQVGRLAAALCRVPVVSSLVGLRYGPEQFSSPQFKPARLRAAQVVDVTTARIVRRFHAVSEEVAQTMARRLLLPRRRVEVINRGRDPEVLGRRSPARRMNARAQLGVGSRPVVLAVARHEHVKGLDHLIDAVPPILEVHPDAAVLIAGKEGNATQALATQVEQAGLEPTLRFLGARDDVPDLMCAADVLVMPSRSEGFPGTLVEAMMLELPIVASDLPAVHEVVGARAAATTTDCADAHALAAAVCGVIAQPPDVEALRQRAIAEFGIGAVAAKTTAFYERALGVPAQRTRPRR